MNNVVVLGKTFGATFLAVKKEKKATVKTKFFKNEKKTKKNKGVSQRKKKNGEWE